MKVAVKTAVLSKRWKFLWSSVPDLDFYYSNEYEKEFVNLVDRTLILYQGSKIREFRVDFDYKDWFASHVDSWIRFVVRRKVEELDLHLSSPLMDDNIYELPQHLYSIAFLRKLRLRFCHIRHQGLFSWRLLETLSLAYIYMSDNMIQNILSGSPSLGLQVLDLQECRGLMHVNITSLSLKKLILQYDNYDCTDSDYDSKESDLVLEISAPYLESLAILRLWDRKFCLMNLPCLVRATLKFQVIPGYEGYHNILREALEKLHYVMDLTIGCWCIQVLSTWELKILPSPSSNCKCLTLDPCLNNWDLAGIANLLRSSPDLETLVVDMAFPRSPLFDSLVLNGFGGENYWKSTKPFFQCLLQNLKTVRIVSFISRRGEMDLVQFLLKHAMVLEKMMIYSKRLAHLKWRKCFKPEELLEFTQMILSFPRASPHAVILFS